MGNSNLRKAKRNKNDEFFTRISDIEKEMVFYKDRFKDKVIFCNCDDPEYSNFWKYFYMNFKHLGLKKLIATHYNADRPTYKLEYDGTDVVKARLKENGDFRSFESIELLKSCDIVITNPPFSLFREYVAQLMEYGKEFLIIGNYNAITYKEIFSLMREDKVWIGHRNVKEFILPKNAPTKSSQRTDEDGVRYQKFGNISWFTNLDTTKRHEDIILFKNYYDNPEDYPRYDNYEAINVDKVKEIPVDYDGLIGVPMTFMDKYNPEQFEIVDALNRYALLDKQNTNKKVREARSHTCNIDGKAKYFRIVIRKRRKTDGK